MDTPMTESTPVKTMETEASPVVETKSKVEQVQQLTDVPNETKDTREEVLIPTDDYRTSPLFYEVVNYLHIPEGEWERAKNEVSAIVDYVIKEINSNEIDKILVKLSELRSNMYDPGEWGTSAYKMLYRYIRLAAKKQSIEKAMGAFEKEKQNG